MIVPGRAEAAAPAHPQTGTHQQTQRVQTGSRAFFRLDVRASMIAGATRGVARRAGGVAPVAVERSASGTVSCGRNIALGLAPTSSGPFQAAAGASAPLGINRWRTTLDGSDAQAICVKRSAFGAVKIVKRSSSFRAGRAAATVATACPRRHTAIGGVELPLMEGKRLAARGQPEPGAPRS